MRLRNIPRADDTLQAHFTVIKNPKEFRGNWTSVFGNDRPIRIEIGMGKGRFLLNMANLKILRCQIFLLPEAGRWNIVRFR